MRGKQNEEELQAIYEAGSAGKCIDTVAVQQIPPRAVGDSFTLNVEVATSNSLHSFTFELTFNPAILKAIGVEPGLFLSAGGVDPITCETPQIDNTIGRITGISCQRHGADGISGSGVLEQISFEAIGIKVNKSA